MLLPNAKIGPRSRLPSNHNSMYDMHIPSHTDRSMISGSTKSIIIKPK